MTSASERDTVIEVADVHPANWVWRSLRVLDTYRIGSVIPDSFSAYASVDHESNRRHRRPSRQLPEQLLRIVYNLLSDATATPDRCWFCVWGADGRTSTPPFRDLNRSRRAVTRRRRRLQAFRRAAEPNVAQSQIGLPRVHYLYRAKLSDMGPLRGFPWGLAPNLWWPEDRAWCVSSETNFTWTYIGGSRALIDSVCEHPQLKARGVRPEDPVAP
jgi:hypothetical protein